MSLAKRHLPQKASNFQAKMSSKKHWPKKLGENASHSHDDEIDPIRDNRVVMSKSHVSVWHFSHIVLFINKTTFMNAP